MVCSITAAHLTSGWTESIYTAQVKMIMSVEHMKERYESPYHSFFKFYGNQWPDNGSYEGWWGHDTLPKLNYEESQELENYILDIGRKWVSAPYNVDGWRLDVAADLGYSKEYNHEFWKKFRKAVKEG